MIAQIGGSISFVFVFSMNLLTSCLLFSILYCFSGLAPPPVTQVWVESAQEFPSYLRTSWIRLNTRTCFFPNNLGCIKRFFSSDSVFECMINSPSTRQYGLHPAAFCTSSMSSIFIAGRPVYTSKTSGTDSEHFSSSPVNPARHIERISSGCQAASRHVCSLSLNFDPGFTNDSYDICKPPIQCDFNWKI